MAPAAGTPGGGGLMPSLAGLSLHGRKPASTAMQPGDDDESPEQKAARIAREAEATKQRTAQLAAEYKQLKEAQKAQALIVKEAKAAEKAKREAEREAAAAAKKEAAEAKAAQKEAEAAQKAAEAAQKAAEKTEKEAERMELKRKKEEEVEAKKAQKIEEQEAKEAQKAQKEAEKLTKAAEQQAEKQAKEQEKLQKQAAALAMAQQKEAEKQAKAAEQKAKAEAAEAAKLSKQLEAQRAEREAAEEREREIKEEAREKCLELEREIHKARWEARTLGDDFMRMVKRWKAENCDEIVHGETDMPTWFLDLATILKQMQQAIVDAEEEDAEEWELKDETGAKGMHQEYADEFEKEAAREQVEEESGESVVNAVGKVLDQQGGEQEDDVMETDDAFLSVDLRVRVKDVGDVDDDRVKWRNQVRVADYESKRPVMVRVEDASAKSLASGANPKTGAVGYKNAMRLNTNPASYPSGIPQEFIDAVHLESPAMDAALRAFLRRVYAGAPEEVLESVATYPMSVYDAPWMAQFNSAQNPGEHETLWAVSFVVENKGEATQELIGRLITGLIAIGVEEWSRTTAMTVVNVGGTQDMKGYLAAQAKIAAMNLSGKGPNDAEKAFMDEQYPGWRDMRPDDQLETLRQTRHLRSMADLADAAAQGAADERKIQDTEQDRQTVSKANKK